MSFRNEPMSYRASGAIAPSTFVKLDSAQPNSVLAAGANVRVCGIAEEGVKGAPGLAGTTGNAADAAGDSIRVYSLGDTCLLKAGTGGWVTGDTIQSDASGQGVVSAATGIHQIGAIAQEPAAAGEFGLVQIVLFEKTL